MSLINQFVVSPYPHCIAVESSRMCVDARIFKYTIIKLLLIYLLLVFISLYLLNLILQCICELTVVRTILGNFLIIDRNDISLLIKIQSPVYFKNCIEHKKLFHKS